MTFTRCVNKGKSAGRHRRLHCEPLELRLLLAGEGLSGQYFHNVDFTGLAGERVEAVDFQWNGTSPLPGLASDTYSVRWSGQVEPLYSEEYMFITTSNQGVRLWVDGQLLVDNWDPHNTEEDTGKISLVAGQKYDLRLDYYEQFGAAEIQLEWLSNSQARETIPAARLYASQSGLLGTYRDDFGGGASRVDAVVDFQWGTARPHPSTAVDRFQITWTGQLRGDFSESYTFTVTSDEAARLWIGGELVIDDWQPHATRTASGTKTLEAGKWYDVRLEYRDVAGDAEVQLAWASPRQTGGATPQTVPSQNLRAAKAANKQFFNPLGPGQDPFVVRWNNSYLHIRSAGNAIYIDQADRLQDIHPSNPASSTALAWTAPPGTSYSEQIWAPELHQIDGKWYIYVAASDGDNATHRMHVLERDHPDPMGPYVYRGKVSANPDKWAIDGTVLEWDGKLYFVWSGWPGDTNTVQNLYIAEMQDPLTIGNDRHLISTPTFAWEQHGLPINEGPQILVKGGKLHIIYSGSGYWRDEYALGRLTYNGTGSLLDAASWQKSPTPVFRQAGDVVGTGHASFTTSPDGTEHWIVYHAHRDPGVFEDDRVIYIQPFEFTADAVPDFGTPIQPSTAIDVPSGEVEPNRPLVVGDYDASGVVDGVDYLVWKQSFGELVFPGVSADGNADGVVGLGDYTVFRDHLGESDATTTSTVAYWRHEEGPSGQEVSPGPDSLLDSSGQENHMRTFDPSFTGATYVSNVSPVPLRSGLPNNLALEFGPGGDDAGLNDDNYTNGKGLNSLQFDELTVELAFRMNSVGGFQALLGKDGSPVSSPVPPLKLMVRGDSFPNGISNQLFVEWIDGDGDIHYLASGRSILPGEWNHVAFVLSHDNAGLFVAKGISGYELLDSIAAADFAGPSSEVLYNSAGSFSVGRGFYNGGVADWADATIDEVRISAAALAPTEFLFDVGVQQQVLALDSSFIASHPPERLLLSPITLPIDRPISSANGGTLLSDTQPVGTYPVSSLWLLLEASQWQPADFDEPILGTEGRVSGHRLYDDVAGSGTASQPDTLAFDLAFASLAAGSHNV